MIFAVTCERRWALPNNWAIFRNSIPVSAISVRLTTAWRHRSAKTYFYKLQTTTALWSSCPALRHIPIFFVYYWYILLSLLRSIGELWWALLVNLQKKKNAFAHTIMAVRPSAHRQFDPLALNPDFFGNPRDSSAASSPNDSRLCSCRTLYWEQWLSFKLHAFRALEPKSGICSLGFD